MIRPADTAADRETCLVLTTRLLDDLVWLNTDFLSMRWAQGPKGPALRCLYRKALNNGSS